MPRTKRYNKKYTYTKRVRKGGGLMNLIRRRNKDNVDDKNNEKISDKNKIDLIILALGGMEEVARRAKANEEKLKEKLKNEVDNPLVRDKSLEKDSNQNTPPEGPPLPPLADGAALATLPPRPLYPPPPPSGGRRTRQRRHKY
tara:strand:- start:53 stop:481 length:429 start_codon:yes stop_codon:yes gene_type:complete